MSSALDMSAEHDNFEIFKDILSNTILERYSTSPRKRMAKRIRKSAQAPATSIQSEDESPQTDPAELAEFIEVITP